MKISKIYSNQEHLFPTLIFDDGLNLILAKKVNDDISANLHNLGKTTLLRLIDFCLLKKTYDNFLLNHKDKFKMFDFAIELKISDDFYLTVVRGVEDNTRISLKISSVKRSDVFDRPDFSFDHNKISIDRAKEILDGYIQSDDRRRFSYRSSLQYFLKAQKTYNNPFESEIKGPEKQWKPHFISLMGFSPLILENIYFNHDKVKSVESDIKRLEILTEKTNKETLDDRISFLKDELSEIENKVNKFNFYKIGDDINKQIIQSFDDEIYTYQMEKMNISKKIKGIKKSIKSVTPSFSVKSIEKLFNDVNIAFDGKIKKSYQDLLAFNRDITKEREVTFNQELENLSIELLKVDNKLKDLEKSKSDHLKVLISNDSIEKFKHIQSLLTVKRLDIEKALASSKDLDDLTSKLKEVENLKEKFKYLKKQLDNEINNNNFKELKKSFSYIIDHVVSSNASISMKLVKESGNPQFSIKFVYEGEEISLQHGHTYTTLTAIAFILSVLKIHRNKNFINFAYLDGVFEDFDDDNRILLLEILIEYAKEYDIQIIITSLMSHIPDSLINSNQKINLDDGLIFKIVRTLDNSGDEGRLFKMPEW